ncbi:MAG: hypothetical protein ING44_11470 [Telmatospirillum sp.]|nr:hypothetical protein [Telmatospirillum sp.]
MINKKTLLVVGAGASAEFNLPTGIALRESVIQSIHDDRALDDPTRFRSLIEIVGLSESQFNSSVYADIRNAQEIILQGLGLYASIDSFLFAHAKNRFVIAYGKLAIVRAIVKAESRSTLAHVEADERERRALDACSNSWLFEFFQTAFDGHNVESVADIFKSVSFIVFNYDRCVEKATYVALRKGFNISHDKAAQILSSVTILHPYGVVGPLFRPDAPSVLDFGREVLPSDEETRAHNIRTLAEESSDRALQARMLAAICESEQAFFVGFGFHRQNIEILNANGNARIGRVYGTAYGISDVNADIYARQVEGAFRAKNEPTPHLVKLHPELKSREFISAYRAVLAS